MRRWTPRPSVGFFGWWQYEMKLSHMRHSGELTSPCEHRQATSICLLRVVVTVCGTIHLMHGYGLAIRQVEVAHEHLDSRVSHKLLQGTNVCPIAQHPDGKR